jgi:hypothetical protein
MDNKSRFALAVAAVVAAGGVAGAAIPDKSGMIHACRDPESGVLRVIDPPESCRDDESPITWSHGVAKRWYADRDGDTFGDWYDHMDSPVQPPGYVPNNHDCNDDRGDVNPGTGNSGSPCTTSSSPVHAPAAASASRFDASARRGSTAPFGGPVVPDV